MKFLALAATLVLFGCSSGKGSVVPLPRVTPPTVSFTPVKGCGSPVYKARCSGGPATQVSNPSTDPYYLCPAMAEVPVPVPSEMPK